MNTRKHTIIDVVMFVGAWLIVPLAYLSWCFFTIEYKDNFWGYLATMAGISSTVIWNIVARGAYKLRRDNVNEIRSVSSMVIVVSAIIGMCAYSEFSDNNIAGLYLILVANIISNVLVLCKTNDEKKSSFIKPNATKYIWWIVVFGVMIALSYDNGLFIPKWDGLLYFDAVKNASLDSLSSVALYGHISLSAGAVYRLFAVMLGNIAEGMYVANVVLMYFSVMAFYGVLKEVISSRKEYEYIIASACYALSPFVLGMAGYFSTDWFCMCSATILLYFIVKREWIWTTIAACFFCFSKEPALIAYAGMCLGLVFSDFISEGTFKARIIKVISTAHYYFMLIPYILWYASYRIMGKWSAGNGGFELDINYILEKIKVFTVLSFNWIILLGVLAFLAVVIFKKEMIKNRHWIFSLIGGNSALVLFNCLFKTVNHARYIDSFLPFQLIMAVVGILLWKKERFRVITLSVIAMLSLISCYMTIDPVSLAVFNSMDVGNTRIISTSNVQGGDASIYNKQLLWMEKPLNEAINDAYCQNTAIIIPAWSESIYASDGISELINLDKDFCNDVLYLDMKEKKRVPYAHDDTYELEEIDIFRVREDYCIDDNLYNNDRLSVIYVNGINSYKTSKTWRVVDTVEYSYRGWIISRDILERNEE